MDGRICNCGRLPWRREPLSLQAQGEAQICRCPWATAMQPPGTAQQGHGVESSRPRGPPRRPAPFASGLIAPVTLQFPK